MPHQHNACWNLQVGSILMRGGVAGESEVQNLTNNFFNLNQYMHETYLNNMKVKACMQTLDTIFDHPETLQNEKVKLG